MVVILTPIVLMVVGIPGNHFLVHYLQSRLKNRGEHDMDTWRGSTDTPVTFQVIAEEWILKAKSWEGAKGFTEIHGWQKRGWSQGYILMTSKLMSHSHETVMLVERTKMVFMGCVIAIWRVDKADDKGFGHPTTS